MDCYGQQVTAEEFELQYAERSGVTVEWLRERGRVVRPCNCGSSDCEGWQSINRELADEIAAERLDELKEVLPKPYADYVPDF